MAMTKEMIERASRRKSTTDFLLEVVKNAEETKLNYDRYKEKFEAMTDEQFDRYMQSLRDDTEMFYMQVPNLIAKVNTEDLYATAEKLKLEVFERLWVTDAVTGEVYLTPNRYLVANVPIRRQIQVQEKKISTSNGNVTDAFTGQPAGDARASGFTFPETHALNELDLHSVLHEFVNVRGGNIYACADLKRQLEESGSASSAVLADSRTRVAMMTKTIFECMHYEINL